MTTKVRFAPSPTGELHLGSARTALYNFLQARKTGGKFILRLEDTDQERYVEGSEKRLLEDLHWLGLDWDEGPDKPGDNSPYVQSQRLDIYMEYIRTLITSKKAYYCFCTRDRLDELRKTQQELKQPTMYDRRCLNLGEAEVNTLLSAETPKVVRLYVPDGTTEFVDGVHGDIKIQNKTIDDQVLLKSDGFPTYHFANVVDDHLMEITDVIRGEEWLPSTAKHVLLYKAFGWTAPNWFHLPNVLNSSKSKLSKRRDGDAVWISTYREQGYLPQALLNFLALLGWHPTDNQEVFTMDELISKFDLSKVQKAGAVFDVKKLDWFNSQYIKTLPAELLDEQLQPFYPTHTKNTIELTRLLQTRLNKFSEADTAGDFYFADSITYDSELLTPKKGTKDVAIEALSRALEIFDSIKDWQIDAIKIETEKIVASKIMSRGDLLWPIRVALSGLEKSADVFDMLLLLGKTESIRRTQNAVKMLKKS